MEGALGWASGARTHSSHGPGVGGRGVCFPEPPLDALPCEDLVMKAEGLSTPASRELSLHPTAYLTALTDGSEEATCLIPLFCGFPRSRHTQILPILRVSSLFESKIFEGGIFL